MRSSKIDRDRMADVVVVRKRPRISGTLSLASLKKSAEAVRESGGASNAPEVPNVPEMVQAVPEAAPDPDMGDDIFGLDAALDPTRDPGRIVQTATIVQMPAIPRRKKHKKPRQNTIGQQIVEILRIFDEPQGPLDIEEHLKEIYGRTVASNAVIRTTLSNLKNKEGLIRNVEMGGWVLNSDESEEGAA